SMILTWESNYETFDDLQVPEISSVDPLGFFEIHFSSEMKLLAASLSIVIL
ncbi:hypothetical protein ACJX0J_033603, partial [Zea mays]